jgi:large subunit ribosomal protein L29
MLANEEIKDQTVEQLKALHEELSKEIFELRNRFRIERKMEKTHLIRHKKRDRARVLTFLRQKELSDVK